MKCPKCNGRGAVQIAPNVKGLKRCPVCGGSGEVSQILQTNEEWLRTLPADEQVKEVLSRGFMTEKRTAEDFVEWLKEIHK